MTPRKTQLERIRSRLEQNGSISRNECLRSYISRLAARISDLEAEGWRFATEKVRGDFVYRVVERPKARQLSLI